MTKPGVPVRASRYALAMGAYAALVLIYTWPAAERFQTSVFGYADAYSYLWNVWWLREAIRAGHSVWDCALLLHPFGADLVQHDLGLWR
jgi:hypothetical protein